MRTVQIDNEPHLWRLMPESEIEQKVLGELIAATAERYRGNINLPNHPDHAAVWECASRVDEAGFAPAVAVVRRPRAEGEEDVFAALFGSDEAGPVEVARVKGAFYVAVSDPEQADRIEVMYDLPRGEWVPGPHGSSNYLYYGPTLYTSNRESV